MRSCIHLSVSNQSRPSQISFVIMQLKIKLQQHSKYYNVQIVSTNVAVICLNVLNKPYLFNISISAKPITN